MLRSRSLAGTAAAVVTACVLVACGSSDSGSAERFCGEIAANRAELTDPTMQFSDDIEPFLDLYRGIADLAPLAIEEEWRDLIAAYETAATVVPGEADSEQTALAAIYSAERSASEVDRWLLDNCAVDIGPVFTIVAQGR